MLEQESLPGCLEIKRPLISYAGSAAETSIDSEPMGNEFGYKFIQENFFVKGIFFGVWSMG